jgi:hypothetical protein
MAQASTGEQANWAGATFDLRLVEFSVEWNPYLARRR